VQAIIDAGLAKEAAIQEAIDAIDALPTAANLTLSDAATVEAARGKVQDAIDLGAVNAEITNLNDLVALEGLLDALQAATDAVVIAESSEDQADVDAARALVNALPDGGAKTALGARLDIVQAIIEDVLLEDAIQAAVNAIAALPAESDLTLAHGAAVEAARGKVNTALDLGADDSDITNLAALVALEGLLDALQAATAAVETAEESKDQADVNAAKTLVNALPDGGAKTALAARLDAVQAIIDAGLAKEAAIQEAIDAIDALPAESDLTLAHGAAVEAARGKVDAAMDLGADEGEITNLDDLVALEELLDDLQEATDAVEAAELSKAQTDVDTARALVGDLTNGVAKTALAARLDAVQAFIDAQLLAAIQAAEEAIVGLPTAANLTLDDADAVAAARGKVQAAIDLGAVNADITNLDALVALEGLLDALQAATAAVETAEDSEDQADVDTARALVGDLPDGGAKSALAARLDDVQDIIDARLLAAIQAAEDAIDELPTAAKLTLADAAAVKAARGKVDAALGQGADEGDIANLGYLVALEGLLDDLQAAADAVEAAEESEKQADVDAARKAVNALPDGADKGALKARLDALQVKIDKNKETEGKDLAGSSGNFAYYILAGLLIAAGLLILLGRRFVHARQ
jgi:tetrahydromethanopterin S-methyltransferase subunit B